MTSRAESWMAFAQKRSSEARQSLVVADERMKQQIAELLHGPIQSRLLIASVQINRCLKMLPDDPKRARLLLHQIRADIEDLREREIRQVSHLLHPSVLRVGLLPALRSLTRRFDGYFRTHIDCDAHFERLNDMGDAGFPPSWQLICYRIVEECLNNAYFHAAPSNVHIKLHIVAGTHVELRISDDGHGFEPDDVVPGLGFMTIFARAADASGTVSIESKLKTGTTVVVRLPMPRQQT